MATLGVSNWTFVDLFGLLQDGYGGSATALNHAEDDMMTVGKASGCWRRQRQDQNIYPCPPSSQGFGRPRSRPWRPYLVAFLQPLLFATVLLTLLVPSTSAAFVHFENCLEQSIIRSDPVQLQFVPLNVTAQLQRTGSGRNLNVTVYGNVTGSESTTPPPPPGDPRWQNANETLGKIIEFSPANNKYSTFFTKFQYLSYTAYEAPPSPFCQRLDHGSCPLAPAFDVNA